MTNAADEDATSWPGALACVLLLIIAMAVVAGLVWAYFVGSAARSMGRL